MEYHMGRKKGLVLLAMVVLCSGLLLAGHTGAMAKRTVVIGTDSGDQYELLNSFAPQIKEELGIDIEFVTFPLRLQYETLMLNFTAGKPVYDLITFFPKHLGDYGPYFTDLNTITGNFEEDMVVDDVIAGFLYAMKYRDKWVGVPFDGDVCTITYRKDLFEDPEERAAYKKKYSRSLRPPKTYEEFIDIAEFFTRPEQGLWGNSAIYERHINIGHRPFSWRLLARGGEYFDGQGKARVNDEIGVWALENYAESLKYAPPGAIAFDYDATRQEMFEGRTAMQEHWPCMPKVAADARFAVEKVRKNVGIAPLPGRWGVASGRDWAIPLDSPNAKEDAYAVLMFFSEPELSAKLVSDTTTHLDPWRVSHLQDPSLYKELYAAGSAEEFCEAELIAAEYGIPDFNVRGAYRFVDSLTKRISECLVGKYTAKEALDLVAAEWDEIVESNKEIMIKEIEEWHRSLASVGYIDFLREPNWND